ncbi:ABC transporter permease [Selenomonas sp. oral taxon 137]|jgi:nickel ABC superfamily ATP binding cassette transporter, permease protein|uniref:ABC transporter, permease protein n=2 Tax=Selenomonas TaxID=970 RepID=E7N2B7_9FIRM|nr:ABC transporter, permease protein [Selenomonas artemidis F0399]
MKPLLRRCLQFIPVFFGITLLSFGLLYIAPSDPVSIRLTEDGTAANPEVVARMRAEMGLDEPFLVQYGTWLTHFVQGDMGKSYITDIPVAKTFSSALPYTLRMAGMAMLLTLLVSLPLGISIAALRGSRFDYGIRLLTFVTNAMPNFVIAIVLMYIFSFKLGLIPVLATTKPIGMILPSATLAIVMSSRYIRQIRAAALDELDKDYIVGLRARGIPERQILFGNVLKNIMVIVITLTGISVGSLLGGTVIVETIFNWPGIGHLIMTAISNRDYPIVQATVVWMALAFFFVNLLADLSYRYFNPKIKDL